MYAMNADTAGAMAALPVSVLPFTVSTNTTDKKGKIRMKRSLYPRHFGRRVRILREDMRLSQPELVKLVTDQKIELTQSYLSKLENAKQEDGSKVPNGEVVGALAKALQTSADFLMSLTDDPDVAVPGGKEEVGLHPETSEVVELMDKLSPASRQEIAAMVKAVYKAEGESRAENARKFRRLLDTVGKVAGPEVRAQIEQSILADSLEVSGNSVAN